MDRYILNRSSLDADIANFWLGHETIEETESAYFRNTPLAKQDTRMATRLRYAHELSRVLNVNQNRTILLKNSAKLCDTKWQNDIKHCHWPVRQRSKPISKPQVAVLDLPNIRNDICCNVLHWSSNDHIVAALDKTIYLWHVHSSSMTKNIVAPKMVISLRMDFSSSLLAFGCKDEKECEIKQLCDLNASKISFKSEPMNCNHHCYITCIEYHPSNRYLILGCKKGNLAVMTKSLRLVSPVRAAHSFDVINVKCSPDGRYVASSGFDGYVQIWTFPNLDLVHSHFEKYCSRGLSWHPWRSSYLCVGTTEGKISLIDASTCKCSYSCADRTSIIYNVSFNKISGELVTSQSCHYNTEPLKYQVNVLSNLNRVVDRFEGHAGRVLFLEWSPDNTLLASAGADETIHLWNFFEKPRKRYYKKARVDDYKIDFNLENFIR